MLYYFAFNMRNSIGQNMCVTMYLEIVMGTTSIYNLYKVIFENSTYMTICDDILNDRQN